MFDEQSSCWLPVLQRWSGAAGGSHFIPRIGMEVVVAFEGRDPDKPLILGCLPDITPENARSACTILSSSSR